MLNQNQSGELWVDHLVRCDLLFPQLDALAARLGVEPVDARGDGKVGSVHIAGERGYYDLFALVNALLDRMESQQIHAHVKVSMGEIVPAAPEEARKLAVQVASILNETNKRRHE